MTPAPQMALPFALAESRKFDGQTFVQDRDGERLKGLLDRVRDFMRDGEWHGLAELVRVCGGTEASVSARVRDLRKPKFGGFTIEREHRGRGLFVYRMVL